MTRKDYVLIAEAFASLPKDPKTGSRGEAVGTIYKALVAMFAKDNPRFDEKRFWEACYK